MTFYDALVMIGGAVFTIGAFLAARNMSPGRVRYVGLPRRGSSGERAKYASDEGRLVSAKETHAAARSERIKLLLRDTVAHTVSVDAVDYLWRDYLWEHYLNRPASSLDAGKNREEEYALLLGAVAGTTKTHLVLAERQFLQFIAKEEASPELQVIAKQSRILEGQDRKVRELEQRIRQLEERARDWPEPEEKQTLQATSKAVH